MKYIAKEFASTRTKSIHAAFMEDELNGMEYQGLRSVLEKGGGGG